ncbi:hypothetical protein PR048_024052 [Dryococelus australis]|uniref:Uncharacterized protein n=1 Tax=Dryococelus australis TaxID=614101 RepID=A0ABQ9GVW4_9NEOP|nr:hypothetical protein PR048_024052 [Dryococelus australis]
MGPTPVCESLNAIATTTVLHPLQCLLPPQKASAPVGHTLIANATATINAPAPVCDTLIAIATATANVPAPVCDTLIAIATATANVPAPVCDTLIAIATATANVPAPVCDTLIAIATATAILPAPVCDTLIAIATATAILPAPVCDTLIAIATATANVPAPVCDTLIAIATATANVPAPVCDTLIAIATATAILPAPVCDTLIAIATATANVPAPVCDTLIAIATATANVPAPVCDTLIAIATATAILPAPLCDTLIAIATATANVPAPVCDTLIAIATATANAPAPVCETSIVIATVTILRLLQCVILRSSSLPQSLRCPLPCMIPTVTANAPALVCDTLIAIATAPTKVPASVCDTSIFIATATTNVPASVCDTLFVWQPRTRCPRLPPVRVKKLRIDYNCYEPVSRDRRLISTNVRLFGTCRPFNCFPYRLFTPFSDWSREAEGVDLASDWTPRDEKGPLLVGLQADKQVTSSLSAIGCSRRVSDAFNFARFNNQGEIKFSYNRLARSSPTKANRVQSPAGSPEFCKWESCRTMPLVGEFSRGSPISPPLHSGVALYSLQLPSLALKTSLISIFTKTIRVRLMERSLPYFLTRESCRMMPLVVGFSRGSPVSPALISYAPPNPAHFTFVASQNLEPIRRTIGFRAIRSLSATNMHCYEETRHWLNDLRDQSFKHCTKARA